MDPKLNQLVNVNLRYSQAAEPLKIRAYAQIVIKILYLNQSKPLKKTQITGEVATALECSNVDDKAIQDSLSFLAKQEYSKHENGRWAITKAGEEAVACDVDRSAQRINNILNRHFDFDINRTQLHEWFIEASIVFFSKYGENWVKSICKGIPIRESLSPDLEAIITDVINKYYLKSYKEKLIMGFYSFITSTLPEDSEQLWIFGQAMFSSKLVAANISADPLSSQEIRDSKIILDTNVLVAASLERHTLSSALGSLAKALQKLNVSLHYLNITKEEYTNLITVRSENIKRVISRYDSEVLENSMDYFYKTAIARFCKTEEDFENFFTTIKDPPSSLDDSEPIEILDYAELSTAVDVGVSNTKRKKEINDAWQTSRKRYKRKRAIEHDNGLLSGGEFLRGKGDKCWILTLDRTLHHYDLKRTKQMDMPLLLSLDVLIQVLGLDAAGPDFDPSVFAPLMASIIRYQFDPFIETYNVEDLAWLLDIEERCADLPKEKIRSFALKVKRARLSGAPKNDSELQLSIQRAFQGVKMKLTESLELSEEILKAKDKELERTFKSKSKFEEELRKEKRDSLRKRYKNRLHKSILIRLFSFIFLTFVAWFVTALITDLSNPIAFWGIFITSLGIVFGFIFSIFNKVIPQFKTDIDNIENRVNEEIKSINYE